MPSSSGLGLKRQIAQGARNTPSLMSAKCLGGNEKVLEITRIYRKYARKLGISLAQLLRVVCQGAISGLCQQMAQLCHLLQRGCSAQFLILLLCNKPNWFLHWHQVIFKRAASKCCQKTITYATRCMPRLFPCLETWVTHTRPNCMTKS